MFSNRMRAAASATRRAVCSCSRSFSSALATSLVGRLVLQPQPGRAPGRWSRAARLACANSWPCRALSFAEPGLRHAQGVLGRQQRVLLALDLQLRHPAAAGHREQALVLVGLGLRRVARAAGFLEVGARFLHLRPLHLRQLGGALGDALLVLLLLQFHRLPAASRPCAPSAPSFPGTAFHSRSASSSFSCACSALRRGLDRAPGVEPGQHVALGHRLAFGDVEVGQFAIDRRVDAPHFRVGQQRALRRRRSRWPGRRTTRPAPHSTSADHRQDDRAG